MMFNSYAVCYWSLIGIKKYSIASEQSDKMATHLSATLAKLAHEKWSSHDDTVLALILVGNIVGKTQSISAHEWVTLSVFGQAESWVGGVEGVQEDISVSYLIHE